MTPRDKTTLKGYFTAPKVPNTEQYGDLIDSFQDAGTGGEGGGHVIQTEGTPLTARPNLNFVGAGVSVEDDSGNDSTKVTISNGGGVPANIIVHSTVAVSNPPTEAELIAAIGLPETQIENNVYIVDDGGIGSNVYTAIAANGHWWVTPLAKTIMSIPTVSIVHDITLVTGAWDGRAALELLSNGVWVMLYRHGTTHSSKNDTLRIRFSNNYGATWTADNTDLNGNPVNLGSGWGASYTLMEPWLIVAPNGDLLAQCWRIDGSVGNYGAYQSRSTDNGLTWSSWTQIDFIGITGDENIYFTDDHFVYNGVIYAAARYYQEAGGAIEKNIFVRSTNNGETWEWVSDITSFAENTQECALEYLGNNRIIAILRGMDHYTTTKAVSNNMGVTWTLTTPTAQGIVGRPRMKTRSHIKGYANWWHDRVLVLSGFVSTVGGGWYNRINSIWISQDAGDTWTGPFHLDTEVDDAGYGDILFDPVNNEYVFVSYQGDTVNSSLKQYNLAITGI